MEPGHRQGTRRPAWLVGLAPLAVLAVAIGLFVLLDAPGLDRTAFRRRSSWSSAPC